MMAFFICFSHCMQQILESVNYCHVHGIVHRDLKVKDGEVVINVILHVKYIFLFLRPKKIMHMKAFIGNTCKTFHTFHTQKFQVLQKYQVICRYLQVQKKCKIVLDVVKDIMGEG